MQFVAPVAGTEAEAWEVLTAALGRTGGSVGQRWTAPAGVPAPSGEAEYVSQSPYDLLLRLDKAGAGRRGLTAPHSSNNGADNHAWRYVDPEIPWRR